MKFYDREKELAVLEKAYARDGADMAVISGRRRVGKSRLIEEFIQGKKAVSVLIVPKEEKQVAKDIEDEIRAVAGYSPSFGTFREAVEYMFEHGFDLVCMDEFPNVLEVNKAIPYEMQRLWDRYKDKKDILLVFSGSYMGMMNKLFAVQKAPLFNRATNTILLPPLPFSTVMELLDGIGIRELEEKIRFFCIFGGIPYYYVLVEKGEEKEFHAAIRSLFFEAGAQLREEGENVLKQEFGGAYSKYYAILEAIHGGYVSMAEISQKLGMRSTTLAKYMKALQKEFRMVERTVPFGQNPLKSKKGLYSITDNTIAFWFSLVYGKRSPPSKEEMAAFLGRRFEFLCRGLLESHLEGRDEKIARSGRWWGAVEVQEGKFEQRDVDIVVETDKALYIGGCKWTGEKSGEAELSSLRESAKALVARTKKPVVWVLFSRSGFSLKETEGVLLFSPDKIVGMGRQ
ncbi:MAG TPA: ATP-binding protein [Candidatus Bilamarchaeaceae archaeon]|nr:ATP-binding protein [Candidatus Bilamarchaeaceae archaeon]